MKKYRLDKNYRLGLSIKNNSIGWAALDLDKEENPFRILDAGTRIFPDGRNPKDGMPLAVIRTKLRTVRKGKGRHRARKLELRSILSKLELLPKDEKEFKELHSISPYELRTKALYRPLTSGELTCVFFHLSQRRGFKSNMKNLPIEEGSLEDQELKIAKKNQELLAQRIIETNSKTLGEYLYNERILKDLPARAKPNEIGISATRSMYEYEFDEIKKSQFAHQNLKEEDWQKIRNTIFYQRPLQPQQRGVCQFINKFNNLPKWASEVFDSYKSSEKNPNAKGLPRANLALPSYMKFRVLSDINNLKIIRDERQQILLDAPQKRKLMEFLNQQKSATFSSLRKEIGFGGTEYRFNLEGGKRTKLPGNETEILLREKLGDKWTSLSLIEQDEMVESMISVNSDDFKKGIGSLCKELLQELVIEMEDQNCSYNTAMKNLEFDLRQKRNNEIQSKLDYYGKVVPATTKPVKNGSLDEIEHGRIANPTVHIALNQMRKLINSIIEENGNPAQIYIEIDKELKSSKEEKRYFFSQQKKNREENEVIVKELEELGQKNSYDNRLKLKLWKELNFDDCNDRKCVYCGNQIGIAKIFSYDVQIGYILPFSKTYDDSRVNKILTHKSCNDKKGNRAPFEAFGEVTFERIKNLPKNKKWRFYEDAMEKFKDEVGFRASYITDKRYLSKVANEYLTQICSANNIRVVNGKLVNLLRHQWGLDSVLNLHLQHGEKNKKVADRRYHAIDAAIIGVTDEKLLQEISLDNLLKDDLDKIVINPPKGWGKFREDVTDAAEKIIVSYRGDHDPNEELHSQIYYGILKEKISDIIEKVDKKGRKKILEKQPWNVVFSKRISCLTKNEISRIRDINIKKELEKLTENVDDKKLLAPILQDFSKKTGIKKIRLLDKIGIIKEISCSKGISPESKNHISLWELPNGEIVTDVVSNLRAIRGNKEELKPHSAAKLLLRLFKGDMVRFLLEGKTVTAKITSISDNTQCWYIIHNFLVTNKEAIGRISLNKNALVKKDLRKIFVSPSGKVFDRGAIMIKKQ